MALGYFGLSIVSAVTPVGQCGAGDDFSGPGCCLVDRLAALVVVVSAGQMTGKAVMYWVSRTSTRLRSPLVQVPSIAGADGWSSALRSALAVTFLSALVGVPPFFIVSMAAGAFGVAVSSDFSPSALQVVSCTSPLSHLCLNSSGDDQRSFSGPGRHDSLPEHREQPLREQSLSRA